MYVQIALEAQPAVVEFLQDQQDLVVMDMNVAGAAAVLASDVLDLAPNAIAPVILATVDAVLVCQINYAMYVFAVAAAPTLARAFVTLSWLLNRG